MRNSILLSFYSTLPRIQADKSALLKHQYNTNKERVTVTVTSTVVTELSNMSRFTIARVILF